MAEFINDPTSKEQAALIKKSSEEDSREYDLPVDIIHHEIIKLLPNDKYFNLLLSNSAFNVLSENEINYRRYNGKKLVDLCKKGDLNGVKYLVSMGADIHADNDAVLISSVYHGHLEVVKYLVSEGADIHTRYGAPLYVSAGEGHLEVVKYLLSVGADIHAYNDAALNRSAEEGYLEVVKYLVSKGAYINEVCLKWIKRRGHIEVLEYLKSMAEIKKKEESNNQLYSFYHS